MIFISVDMTQRKLHAVVYTCNLFLSFLFFLQLDASIKDEISANQRVVPPGKSLLALNGALINIDDIDLYM